MNNDSMLDRVTAYLNRTNRTEDSDSDDSDSKSDNDLREFSIPSTPNSTRSQDSENSRQLIIQNLAEPMCNSLEDNIKADLNAVVQIFLIIGISLPIQKQYRLGRLRRGKVRKLVVQFMTKADKKAALKAAQRNPFIPGWINVSIRDFVERDQGGQSSYQTSPMKHGNTPSDPILDPEKEALKQQLAELKEQMAKLTQVQSQPQQPQNQYANNGQPFYGNSSSHAQQQYYDPSGANSQTFPSNSASFSSNIQGSQPNYQQPQHSGQQSFMQQPPSYQNSQQQPFYGYPGNPNPNMQSNFGNYQNPNYPYQQPQGFDMMQMMMDMYSKMQAASNAQQPPPPQQTTKEEKKESESDYDTCEDDDTEFKNPFCKDQSQRHVGQKRTLNILVLGETGVGKSTWINGIANYMSFDTLEKALNAPKPICLIPSKFSMYVTADEQITVGIDPSHGEKDENECLSGEGESATQDPKTYQLETNKYIVNIIDTPGIGDCRGPKQDKENTRKILNAISNYQDLHAICFLFKSNEARMTQSFKYCIGELLLQLHKDAVDNIIFFFTNARGTFYRPGETMTPLREFLKKLKEQRGLEIQLSTDKICCTDNEAFRMVCADYNGVKFTDEEFNNFSNSWLQAAQETHRFLEFAAQQRPHTVSQTLSINSARTIIYYLAKPLADVNDLIETNIKVMNQRKADLQNTADSIEDLKKKAKIPQIGIKVEPLSYPKTVCAGAECIETVKIPHTEQHQTVYKTVCHGHCYLSNVEVEKVPEPNLQGCAAMSGGKCTNCKCHWSAHMHIRFNQVKSSIQVDDENVKNAIKTNEDASVTKQKMIKDCEAVIDELKAEQKVIIDTSLHFGSFLQANAILPYNDAFEKYVEQTIDEEEKCIQAGGDRTKLNNLKKLLAEYQQEKKLLENAADQAKNDPSKLKNATTIDVNQIQKMKDDLFKLKHTGSTLQNLFQATGDGINKHAKHIVVKYQPDVRPYNNYQRRAEKNKPKKGKQTKGKKR